MENKINFDRVKAMNAQRDFCKRNGKPFFIPSSGYCYCGSNVFDKKGYSVEYSAQYLITGCPFCHRTFCD